jgi:hypothetical protein
LTSAWEGFKQNGNKNGYKMKNQSKPLTDDNMFPGFPYAKGVQTPGFFNPWICRLEGVLTFADDPDPEQAIPCP